MAEKQGSGKHPHKSTEEPWPHTRESGGEQAQGKGQEQRQERARGAGAGVGETSDLKEREYRDAEGNIHHHTRKFMEQHKGEGKEE